MIIKLYIRICFTSTIYNEIVMVKMMIVINVVMYILIFFIRRQCCWAQNLASRKLPSWFCRFLRFLLIICLITKLSKSWRGDLLVLNELTVVCNFAHIGTTQPFNSHIISHVLLVKWERLGIGLFYRVICIFLRFSGQALYLETIGQLLII